MSLSARKQLLRCEMAMERQFTEGSAAWQQNCLAMEQVRSLSKHLASSPEMLRGYVDVLEKQMKAGVIEWVRGITSPSHPFTTYPVILWWHQRKKLKIRVVYNASGSTSSKMKSLHNCLYRGPVLLSDLCSMILRFQCGIMLVMAGFENALSQVELQPGE